MTIKGHPYIKKSDNLNLEPSPGLFFITGTLYTLYFYVVISEECLLTAKFDMHTKKLTYYTVTRCNSITLRAMLTYQWAHAYV